MRKVVCPRCGIPTDEAELWVLRWADSELELKDPNSEESGNIDLCDNCHKLVQQFAKGEKKP